MKNQTILTPYFLDETMPELEALAKPDWRVNKASLPEARTQVRMSVLHQSLADLVAKSMAQGRRPVCIAGDCCSTLGVLAGLQRADLDPVMIWFDAHGDFNTWETTPSGFLGGMPLAMLVGRGEQSMVKAVGLTPFPETRVILTDARDLDPGERALLEESEVVHLPEVNEVFQQVLASNPLYIHFDTDVLNPEEAPAMNYRAPGGPTSLELREVFHYLAGTGHIVAVSMSTWNPKLDQDGQSQQVCMDLLGTLL
ncbi:MAG: arginase family protein [bacterium]